jgi:hypothetical protein
MQELQQSAKVADRGTAALAFVRSHADLMDSPRPIAPLGHWGTAWGRMQSNGAEL